MYLSEHLASVTDINQSNESFLYLNQQVLVMIRSSPVLGGTDEYAVMVTEICKRYPDSKLMAIGFSMGGNVVLKYIGEDNSRQKNFLCVMSLCQGYDAGQ